ncbi:WW domain-containing protein [Artemisia annua]|uniref:WW domain-containing protein n=1 Tax=Artemisia annua TaxID=35608 RepID=A0A2U1PAW4_ARTAN|nr:WW domain-containing protein [Artemisia annua]
MGNRKERRLAAKTGSNRRVKLDLHLPEQPSGDFGDPSNKEEVGGGDNANTHTGSPDSPSSSGQKPENPLMLLGQYSDEEVEEDSSKAINYDNRESSPAAPADQAKIDNRESTKTDKDENITAEKVDQVKVHSSPLNVLKKLEENGVIEDNKTESPHRDMDAEDQASVPLTTDTQTPGDVDSGWTMVLHEESNSYYYWNTVTGETSWEVPVALTHGSESAYDPKSGPQVEEPHVTSVEATETNGSRPELGMYNEKYTHIMANGKNEGNHAIPIDGGNMPCSNDVNYGFSNVEAHHMDTSIQDMTGYVYQGTDSDSSSDSFRLLQLGENLSERLKSLKGLEASNDQLAKLAFELDIRLVDIKSLVPYGSSLLPFWLHSENQLKLLEAAINNEVLKCSQFANTGQTNQAENISLENVCGTSNEKNPPTSIKLDCSDHYDISKETDKVLSNATVALPKDSTTTVEAHENAVEAEAVPIVAPHSVEDIDMDVEMEVEDESSVLNGAQLDQSIPPIPHGQPESHGSEDIPPLPNDEWIPPPPPDDEPMPPPPPEEPPEASIPTPPSEVQAAQPYSYGQQYSFSYPGSGFEYYGQTNNLTTGVASNGFYVDANGCQVAAPVQTLYYAAVPNPYPDAAGEPVTYYTQQESMQAAPVIGTVETSGSQKSAQANIASDQTESSTEFPSSSVSTHALGTSTVTSSVSMVVSAPAVATTVAPTESAPKVQPKVTRNKKRTVAAVTSLRSNKKVSGLVDKWKAVKEEMHEDEEEEPEDALEKLEKKRQREIEQWRAQQIATGEAKNNANFQPLGGDWRERIRRKRAKKSGETEESVAKANDDTNQQPDLVELTKQLPSGWQAYWDEASKEVYYGNTKTSETTWVKPTN